MVESPHYNRILHVPATTARWQSRQNVVQTSKPGSNSKLSNVFTLKSANISYIKINSNLRVCLRIRLTNMSNFKEDSTLKEDLNRKVAFVATLKVVSHEH